MSGHTLPMIACLAFGAADLAFIDAVLLPRVVGGVDQGQPLPAPPPAPREEPAAAAPIPAPPAAPAPMPAPPAAPAPPPAPALALTIHYNTGDAQLDRRARTAVDALVARVAAHPGWSIAVEGHADARGDADFNERLSHDRAQVVVARLGTRGLRGPRVQMAAFGATRPLAEGDAPAALRRNRRVEILIVRGGP
jgi:outer membrane protein OmpA-like peptidoglycan-associated protein